MIAKKIYYCWFGKGKRSEFEEWCMQSWKEKCPDYEIIEINEDNFDININEFCKQAYENKNYAFVSDIARFEVLSKNSGFYLDTDMRLLKSLDELRQYDAIIPLNGKGFYNNSPIGCSNFIDIFKNTYNELTLGKCGNTLLNKKCYEKYNLLTKNIEIHDNIAFLGNEYFITNGYEVTDKTIGIHYCLGSWLDKWNGGYDKKSTFKAFEIYQDGVRDIKTENKYYGDNERIGTLRTINSPMRGSLIFYGNYFYNNKVAKVIGDNFIFERFTNKPITQSYVIEDVIIQCTE